MAVQDIISFLGKEVNFLTSPQIKGSRDPHEDIQLVVNGIVEAITIREDLTDVQICVNGDFYLMCCITLFDILDNPAQV